MSAKRLSAASVRPLCARPCLLQQPPRRRRRCRDSAPRFAVDNKWAVGFDPVTDADKDAEIAIRAVIAERFPDHGIIGEEWDHKLPEQSVRVDRRSHRRHPRLHLRRAGLGHADRPDASRARAVAGMMAQPFTGEIYLSLPGEASFVRAGRLRTHPHQRASPGPVAGQDDRHLARDLRTVAELLEALDRLKASVLQCRCGPRLLWLLPDGSRPSRSGGARPASRMSTSLR